jgi:hypothetical protein
MDAKFDLQKFNAKFNKLIQDTKKKIIKDDANKLNELNNKKSELKPYQLPVDMIFIGIKDSIFGVISDFFTGNFDGILIRQNRLFYFGILILMICLGIYVLQKN